MRALAGGARIFFLAVMANSLAMLGILLESPFEYAQARFIFRKNRFYATEWFYLTRKINLF
jgi:hypothetical protein